MTKTVLCTVAAAALLAAFAKPATAADPASCKTVRFSDVGWTDITATTAVTSAILKSIGYTPKTIILSVPVTFLSLKNNNIDVFLGNWMPAQKELRKPLVEDKSINVVGVNLEGAKYTLAVPVYAYDAGLKSFADIHNFAKPLHDKIYGIEPGNEGKPARARSYQGEQGWPRQVQPGRFKRAGNAGRGQPRGSQQAAGPCSWPGNLTR